MSIRIVVSDAINRRISEFDSERFRAFQLAVADVARGRARGEQVHVSNSSARVIYALRRTPYCLYYSVDPGQPGSVVFEEFLTVDEEDLVMDLFAEGAD